MECNDADEREAAEGDERGKAGKRVVCGVVRLSKHDLLLIDDIPISADSRDVARRRPLGDQRFGVLHKSRLCRFVY